MNPTALTLSAARQLLARREISALELTDLYLERISRYDGSINAFITVTAEHAREQARTADAAFARGETIGALNGIPLAVKDLIDVRGERTTAGSRIVDEVAQTDAAVIARLRAAGAVFLGKVGLHEFAYGVTNENAHFGDVRNPWNVEHIAGGSSGGSAASVSARTSLGALGTDTGGSIRLPAALCGVTGIKPTYGRVSLRGIIPLSWSNDHAGPLAQTAEDCALLLNVLAGYDPQDPVSVDRPVPDYTATLAQPLAGLKFATGGDYFVREVNAEILEAVRKAEETFEALGARRVDKKLDAEAEMFATNRLMLRAEAAAWHRENMTARPQDYGADVLKRLQSAEKVTRTDYVLARRKQVELIRALELWFGDVDFLLTPSTRIPASRRGADAVQLAEHLTAFTAPFDVTGFPAISIPCGFTADGLPIGAQLVGRRWDEALILRAAHQYQQVTDWHSRLPPLS